MQTSILCGMGTLVGRSSQRPVGRNVRLLPPIMTDAIRRISSITDGMGVPPRGLARPAAGGDGWDHESVAEAHRALGPRGAASATAERRC